MNIPLIRPTLPDIKELVNGYKAIQSSGIYTNFGQMYDLACKHVNYHYKGYPVLTNNGTTSLQVALQTTLPRGSRVAIPDFTFIATLDAVVAAGMEPVILDIDKEMLTINGESLRKHKNRYDAFICVSPFGYYVNTTYYDLLAVSLKKKVIYDFAGAFGIDLITKNPVSFSLHATKNLPIGEGGLVIFNNKKDQQIARQLIGFNLDSDKVPIDEFGSNGKLDELHCLMLAKQLLSFNKRKDSAKWIATRYTIRLNCLKEHFQVIRDKGSPQLPVFRFKNPKEVIEKCGKAGISVRRYYDPILSWCNFNNVQVLEKTLGMNDFLALPKNVTDEEFDYIEEVLNR